MPFYHVHVVLGTMDNPETTMLYCSRVAGVYDIFEAAGPMLGFPQLPVDCTKQDGSYYGTKEELRELFFYKGCDFVELEIFKDYANIQARFLDCFVRRPKQFGWSHWRLRMPMDPPRGLNETDEQRYPHQRDWYRAVARTYVGFSPFHEYERLSRF